MTMENGNTPLPPQMPEHKFAVGQFDDDVSLMSTIIDVEDTKAVIVAIFAQNRTLSVTLRPDVALGFAESIARNGMKARSGIIMP